MKVRQFVFAASDLNASIDALKQGLRLDVCYRDPGVGEFGLVNALFRTGNSFLEVVAPEAENTAAGRFLERRGDDGGYMVIFQTDSLAAARERVDGLGVRVVWTSEHDDMRSMHLHPRDVGAAILSIDEATPPESWRWAGPDWTSFGADARSGDVVGVDFVARDPQALAERWGAVLGLPVAQSSAGFDIAMDAGTLHFAQGDSEPAITGVTLEAAESADLTICGTTVRLRPSSR